MDKNEEFYQFKATVLRNEYNKSSPAFIAVQNEHVCMGLPLQNIECSEDGINLNSGVGGLVSHGCMSFIGPFVMKTMWPFDMLPGFVSPFPGGYNYAAGMQDIPNLMADAKALMNIAAPIV